MLLNYELALKNWCFWTVVLEKTRESPLGCKDIKLVHPRGNQSWIFTGRTDDEAETPILWPPDTKNWLTGKDPDAGIDWRREEKGMIEDEMVGWHHWLDGHKLWELVMDRAAWNAAVDMTERLNWTTSAVHNVGLKVSVSSNRIQALQEVTGWRIGKQHCF